MTRNKFKTNLSQALDNRDVYVSDEDLEKFLDLNYDEDGDWDWDFAEFDQFACDVCANFGDFWETVEEYDLHRPEETYYVMYWNDREDYPIAVFEVKATSEGEAEDIALDNGGDAYADEWPVLIETELSESQFERYKNSVWTKYKVVE